MQHALPLLIERARTARDQQSARLAQARQEQDRAQATLQRLQDFRRECLARNPVHRGRTDADSLEDHLRFLGTLDQAMAQQQQQLALRERHCADQQAQLQQLQQRLLAFETLARRQADAKARQAARQEQRATDDFAALAALRRSETE